MQRTPPRRKRNGVKLSSHQGEGRGVALGGRSKGFPGSFHRKQRGSEEESDPPLARARLPKQKGRPQDGPFVLHRRGRALKLVLLAFALPWGRAPRRPPHYSKGYPIEENAESVLRIGPSNGITAGQPRDRERNGGWIVTYRRGPAIQHPRVKSPRREAPHPPGRPS